MVANHDDKKFALFTLSNITGDVDTFHIQLFLQEENLFERVLNLSNMHNKQLKSEATWVLTNAITQVNSQTR